MRRGLIGEPCGFWLSAPEKVHEGLRNLLETYREYEQWAKFDEFAAALLAAGRKQFQGEGLFKLAIVEHEWGRSLMSRERYAEAESHLRQAIALHVKNGSTHGRRYSATSELGECLFRLGENHEAERLLQEGYLEAKQRVDQFPDYIRFDIMGRHLRRLAAFYDGTGRPDRAKQYWQKLSELEKVEGRTLSKDFFRTPE